MALRGFLAGSDLSMDNSVQETEIAQEIEIESESEVIETNKSLRIIMLPDTGTLYSIFLSLKPDGSFVFDDDCPKDIKSSVSISSNGDNWVISCNRPAFFRSTRGTTQHEVVLDGESAFSLENVAHKYMFFVSYVFDEALVLHNYQLFPAKEISIGSAAGCDIRYALPFIQDEYAKIRIESKRMYIEDCSSVFGVFVNSKRVSKRELVVGDKVTILGLDFVIGAGFIAFNDGLKKLSISSSVFRRISSAQGMAFTNVSSDESDIENTIFNRSPRFRSLIEEKEITIEAPPASLHDQKIPLMLRMGGSMVMGGMSALSGNFTMLLSSVLFPMLTSRYTEKDKKEYEERRLVKYREYLAFKKEEIKKEIFTEERILRENYPDLAKVLAYPKEAKHLWERRKVDDDFLHIRLGSGTMPMKAKLSYPAERFGMDEDVLENEMFELAEKKYMLSNVPIMLDLIVNKVISLSGKKEDRMELIKRILMMLSILHSYDELKIILLGNDEVLEELGDAIYIPHVWDNQKSIRFVAHNASEAYQIGEYLNNEVADFVSKSTPVKQILKSKPYYCVIALDKHSFESVEILKDIMQAEYNCGVSVITSYDDVSKDCSLLLNALENRKYMITYLDEIDRPNEFFTMDGYDDEKANEAVKIMSNTNLKMLSATYDLPKTVTFLEMFGVGRIEQLNPLKRWKENNSSKSLATPIGVAPDGSLFELDLHQKYQGPHGLVAGTTGSGKSEFLMTYILSMAINYHPDEVAFVLIDYKGGGLAGAFDDAEKGIHLPHVIGTITNLDGSAIQRSLVSIQSELIRRQRVFNEAKSLTDEGTIDIYQYQKMYRNGIVSEPMPHLFIISDEFAELKQQQPEFMEKLISAARIGRSLGVHLILATQKPAGVVNDQIRSNTKFRVCLKVQDKQDSMDMLKRPEAAELKDTGRFYLQVGYNEFFALGQSAWSGAEYIPQDEVVVQKENNITFVDSVGQTLIDVKPKKVANDSIGAQLACVVRMLTDLAKEEGIEPKSLWKPALPKKMSVEDIPNILDKEIKDESRISSLIGVIDDAENQTQHPLFMDYTLPKHTLIIGEAGYGKTALLQQMILSLISTKSPDEVNFYALDYSSRLLTMFNKIPHCGGVVLEGDDDSLVKLIDMIKKITNERKKLFANLEVDNFESAVQKKKMPLIIVFIDNYASISSTRKGEEIGFTFNVLLRDCVNYGIKFIITGRHYSEVPTKVKQECAHRIIYKLKDKYECSDALACKVDYTAPEFPGRGLCNYEGRPLEFQSVMYKSELEDDDRVVSLKNEIEELINKYADANTAKRIPTVDETIEYDEFMLQFDRRRIPLGYAKATSKLVALPFKQWSTMSVYTGNMTGREPLFNNFIQAIKREHVEYWVIKRAQNSLLDDEKFVNDKKLLTDKAKVYECNSASIDELWNDLSGLMKSRAAQFSEYCSENSISDSDLDFEKKQYEYFTENFESVFLVFESLSDVCSRLEMLNELMFNQAFETVKKRNIFVISFFEPDDFQITNGRMLYNGYAMNSFALLFGGQFDKQKLTVFMDNSDSMKDELQFNLGIVKYRDSYHPLLMPCGVVEEEEEEEDLKSIF